VFAHIVFDPPSVSAGASEIAEALAEYRPRQTIRERPPEPAGAPEADPLEQYRELQRARQRRRVLKAEAHLDGAAEVELLAQLRSFGWPAAGIQIAELVQLDFDCDQPYTLELADELIVDVDGGLTYSGPISLRAQRLAPVLEGVDASEAEDLDEVAVAASEEQVA